MAMPAGLILQKEQHMKKIALLVVLALIGVFAWYYWETKPKPDQEVNLVKPVKASQHSAVFNKSVDSVLQAYYVLSETLVAWDSAKLAPATEKLQKELAGLKLQELQQDSALFTSALAHLKTVQNQTAAFGSANGLEAKRRTFHELSGNLYNLLHTVKYDASKVYLQECPMAFNDEETGNWISQTADIRNPYLGLHHPRYKSGMLQCGEVKDSLVFDQVQ
ncbi:DUF3347 domain-containing protein [Paracnuella aquatica]|nr:DUF3347 domain-containing protein [Paracnuella aquatica]